jgi:hypothetical protein
MARIPRLGLVLLIISTLQDLGQAQNQRPTVPLNSVPMAQAVRVEDAPKMDGTLDDPPGRKPRQLPISARRNPMKAGPQPSQLKYEFFTREAKSISPLPADRPFPAMLLPPSCGVM